MSRFLAFAGAGTVCLVVDPTRARSIAEAMAVVDPAGVDDGDVAQLRAAAGDADRLAAEERDRARRRSLRSVGGGR